MHFLFFLSVYHYFQSIFKNLSISIEKKTLNLRNLNNTTESIFSAIFCNEKTSNYVIIMIIFFWFSKRFSFLYYVQIFSMRFLLKQIFIFSIVSILNATWFFFLIFLFRIFYIIFYFFSIYFFQNLNDDDKQCDNFSI